MDRLIAANSVVSPGDIAPLTGTPQFATSGNPGAGIPATVWPAYQYNAIQEEIRAVIVAGGITPDKTNNGQLAAAIVALIAAAAAAAVPTGTVITTAANVVPTGFYSCDGSSKNTTTDAALFAVIGYTYGGTGANFNVPDTRGLFIRSWGGSFGYDPGRGFATIQADALKTHSHTFPVKSSDPSGAFAADGSGSTSNTVSTDATGDTETRPVNISMLFCIKR